MLYHFPLTIPTNTAKASPVQTTLPLTAGILHHVSIGFPKGCSGLLHVQLYLRERLVFPTTPDADFAWDSALIEWAEYLPLEDHPFQLRADAWNLDDTFPHTVTVRLGVLPPEVYWRTGQTPQLHRQIREAFGLDLPEASS